MQTRANNSPCNVFLTGVTGFVGRYLLYQLCEANWVDEIYVLIRPKRGKTPEDRMSELLKDILFQEAQKQGVTFDKIRLIAGDILQPRLGMSENDITLLSNRVSLVIHNAAALSFAQPILTGLEFNSKPAWDLYKMCSREFELKPAFVLISSTSTNSHLDVVPEKVTPFSAPAEHIYNFISSIPKERSDEQAEWLREGRLDNYAFSKAIIERMIYEDIEKTGGSMPVHMVRPGGIISSFGGPLKGWMHETCFYGQLAYFVYKGKIPFFLAKRDNDINMAPVDLVGNLTMACCLECLEKRKQQDYSVQLVNGSSIMLKDMTFDRIIRVSQENYPEYQKFARASYAQIYKEDGSHIAQDPTPKHPFYLQTKWVLELLFALVVFFPMWLFRLYEGETKRFKSAQKLTNFLYKYVLVLSPYLTRKIDIEHGHCEVLQTKYGDKYPLDASKIDSDEFSYYFIKGVSEHILPRMEVRTKRVMAKFKAPEPKHAKAA